MAPDGAPAWAIACTRSVTECYDECARRCPTGYSIIDRTDEAVSSRSRAVAGDGWAAGRSRSTIDRISMLIECRARIRSASEGAPEADDEDPNQRIR